MDRLPSETRLVAVGCLAAGLIWYLLGHPLDPWQRACALAGGTLLLAGLSEALRRRLFPERPPVEPVVAEPLPIPLAGEGSSRRGDEASRLADDLAVGFKLQRRFLPSETESSFHGLHVAGCCLPARGVSGDTFDYGPLEEDKALLLLADVAGKGIPAALLMTVFHSSFRSRIAVGTDLVPLLQNLNDQLHGLAGPERYVTAFCGIFEKGSGTLDYVNAGHFPPLVWRAGRVEELGSGGFPLGMFHGACYEAGRTTLGPGDLLVVYSDGVLEAVNKAGEEFGRERLEALVGEHHALTPALLRDRLVEALAQWNDDFVQEDDITILVVHREPAACEQ